MKTKYCYIQSIEGFTDESRIYVVFVGSTNREMAQCKRVAEYAKQHGAYWEPWGKETLLLLSSLGYQPFSVSQEASCFCRRLDFNIPAFIKHLEDGDLDIIKTPSYIIRNTRHQLNTLSPTSFVRNHTASINKTCLSVPRHYLSHDNMAKMFKAASNF